MPTDYDGMQDEEIEDFIKFRCSEEDQCALGKEVTMEEVRKALFSMSSYKSPGPDDFPSEFFKTTWSIVGQDFTVAIQSVFQKGFLPKEVNSTILTHVPKKTYARGMKDYRPVSCCNVLYKVISKIIANSLEPMLSRIVTENPSVFVQGRLLMEKVLLASELVEDYHKDTVSPRCAMKIDISKAFDSVQWPFVLQILKTMQFSEDVIHWIRVCIKISSFQSK